ncbi:MAG: cyclodeaminase/cyclohydrolase family protein [Clostridia bacterium]|nr:cyclodeaminase/cyclohydrolase family protein [Clostridia bacterium]
MTYSEKTCRDFVSAVSTPEPIPGGGSVAALVGALGAALSTMVASLTLSSKKYIAVEAEMEKNIQEIHRIQEDLIELVQKDIDNFEPLAKLYKMKSDDPEEKKKIREAKQKALYEACIVPMEIIKKCGRAIELSQEFAVKGNKVVIADSGSSAVLCKAAMQAASFNIYINTNMMKDKELAHKINGETAQRIVYYGALADSVFGYTTNTLMNTVIETDDTI